MSLPKPYRPRTTTKAMRAFPARVVDLMPEWSAVPEEFKNGTSPWCALVRRWFYRGLPDTVEFHAKPGLDAETAYYHLHCILGSFEPKHEHKEATVAYLCSLWFDRVVIDADESYPMDVNLRKPYAQT